MEEEADETARQLAIQDSGPEAFGMDLGSSPLRFRALHRRASPILRLSAGYK